MFPRLAELHDWYAQRLAAHSYQVTRVLPDRLAGWAIEPGTGDIRHDSGRSFSVDGPAVRTDHGPVREWAQPIIDQPEPRILGIHVKRFPGVPHFLMQARTGSGNINRCGSRRPSRPPGVTPARTPEPLDTVPRLLHRAVPRPRFVGRAAVRAGTALPAGLLPVHRSRGQVRATGGAGGEPPRTEEEKAC